MSLGGVDGFAGPSNITPELEHWFAQIAAEMTKAATGDGILVPAENIVAGTFGAGAYTFPTGGDVTIEDTLLMVGTGSTQIRFTDTDLVDLSWDIRLSAAGVFELRSISDTGTTVVNALQIAHATGYATFVDGAEFNDEVIINSGLTVARSAGALIRIRDSGSISDTDMIAYVSLQDSTTVEKGWMGFGSTGNTDLTIRNAIADGHIVLSSSGSSADVVFDINGVSRYTFADTSFATSEPIYSTVATAELILDWGGTGISYIQKITDQGGLLIAADSSTVIHAGDTGPSFVTGVGIVAGTTAENLYLVADSNVYIYPSQQGGFDGSIRTQFATNGQIWPKFLGTVAAPTYSWGDDSNTGMYQYASNMIGFSGGGAIMAFMNATDGVAAYPGFRAIATSSGYFRHAGWGGSTIMTSNLRYVSGDIVGAASYEYVSAVGSFELGGVVLNTLANGTGRGLKVHVAPDSLGAAATVATLTQILNVDTNGIRTASGDAVTPGFAFLDDPDTGIYLGSVGTMGISVAGGLRLSIDSTSLTFSTGMYLNHNSTSARDKIRVWNSGLYTIGMGSGYTFGGLGDYAMTFQMNSNTNRGFWWGTDVDTNAQGAMALTQDGRFTVSSYARFGYGKSDTTSPSSTYAIDANGSIQAVANSSNIIMKTTSGTSSPYISWYQTTTRQMYMQFLNGGTGRINVESSSTNAFEIMTGGVIRFKIDGLDADEGRVYAEKAQMYGGYLNSGTGTGATTVDFDRGNTHHLNNTGSRTMTLAGAVNGTTGIITVEANTGATASWTWSTNIEWVGGSAPTLSTTVGHRDVIMLIYSDAAWLGSYTIGHV